MKENRNLSSPRVGMNRDTASFNLSENEYAFALNTMFESESGDSYNPKNELSNELSVSLPEGFKVVGHKLDTKEDHTLYWITNPDTKECEIGYVKVDGEYKTLVSSPDLNFDIEKPIKKIVLKYEKTGTNAYWVDNKNPDRFLTTSDVSEFLVDGKLDVDKMRIDKIFSYPTVTPISIESGGQLEKGVYEISVTYCDKLGNEVANYISTTNPIHIFDLGRKTMDNTEIGDKTNQAIKVRVDDLDPAYKYFKVFVVQKLNDSTSYFIDGIYPIGEKDIIIHSTQGKERTDINKLYSNKITYVKSEGITSSNGYLFRYGLTAQKEINLQPISNLLGAFVRWQTVQAKEDLYARGEASALYKGYLRDEVYPLSWRVKTNTGYVSALTPFVARPAVRYRDEERNVVVDELAKIDNDDVKSVNANNPQCSTETRDKYWQIYNTAHDIQISDQDIEGRFTTIKRPVTKFCQTGAINSIENKKLYLDLSDIGDFEDLRTFIGEYGDDLSSMVPEHLASEYNNSEVETVLKDEKKDINCVPYYRGEYDEPVLLEGYTKVLLGEIFGEKVEFTYKEEKDYQPTFLETPPQIHELNSEGRAKVNEEFIEEFGAYYDPKPFLRRGTKVSDRCEFAKSIRQIGEASDKAQGYVPQYYGGKLLTDLRTSIDAEPLEGFSNKIHKGAMWFKSKITEGDKAIIEIPKMVRAVYDDTFYVIGNTKVRVSIYTGRCSNLELLKTRVVDVSQRTLLYEDMVSKEELYNDELYVALDFPIVHSHSYNSNHESYYVTAVPNGAIGVEVRAREALYAEVSFDKLTTTKQQRYEANVEFKVPVNSDCEPTPYKNGKFSYWESSEKYPDNKELYDSSWLSIDVEDIDESLRGDFEKYFVASKVNGKYILKESTDLTNKPIRHFKFPDYNVAPFMATDMIAPFTESIIYPLGVTIDKKAINNFLDIAVKNGLLTQEFRDSIEYFEVFRGDRRINKSILGKGLAYDVYSYEEENSGNDILFPNFPYNDLGNNELAYDGEGKDFIPHPFKGERNNKFTFHSPDYDFFDLNIGGEAKIEAYQFGSSRGAFVDVEKHPEWVILGKKAYTLATTLATLEYALEAMIRFTSNIVDSSKNYWFVVGVGSTGGNPIGAGVSSAATIALSLFEVLTNAVPIIGRYRYEWLKTFRDFGKPDNFAFQYSSEGHYNYAIPNSWVSSVKGSEGNTLRGIATGREMAPGRFTLTEKSGKQLRINNVSRENSLLLVFGDEYPVDYPIDYAYHDNSSIDKYGSSRVIQSDTGERSKGKGKEFQRNIASPYMSIKNYIPFQYGSIGSVKWLPTSSAFKLDDDKNVTLFGGDIFISRYTLKRKTPLFTDTAFGLADMLPYEYSRNSNIGRARFYCDYETGKQNDIGDMLFPDFESDYSFDCEEGSRDMYVKSPSKMYLYYYGIPNFLVESEINLNLRYGKKSRKDSFYPEAGDYIEWTQEKNVPISEPNRLNYNAVYSSTTTPGVQRTLADFYDSEKLDVMYDSPNGVIYSLQDNSENDFVDPWQIYRPLDKHQFPTSYGKLIDLSGVGSGMLFGRFENTSVLFNKINEYREAQTAADREAGTGSIFDLRPIEFGRTELGYTGSTSYQMISNEYGYFYADAERGQVFMYAGGNSRPIEISSTNGQRSTNMKAWFKEHLPFKIKDSIVENYEDIDTDNAYNGIGLTMGWDAKYDRVFLTKVDYEPIKEMSYYDGKFLVHACKPIEFCKFTNKQQTIQEKLDQGYKFIEEGCSLVFEKYTEGCEHVTTIYEFPEEQKQALLQDGYTIVGQEEDKLLFEKVEDVCDNNSKQAEIQALLDQGYTQDSVDGCDITFVKQVCSFTGQQAQIDTLISDGYTLVGETECSKVFEKTETVPNKANDDYVEVDEGLATTFNVIANDTTESAYPLRIESFTLPNRGMLMKVSDSSFKYTHDGSDTTTDSFTYTAKNDLGETNLAKVEISIIPFDLQITPDYISRPTFSTGSDTFTITSTHPWTLSEDRSNWVSGSISVDKTSGSSGSTTVTVNYEEGKGYLTLNITSRGITKPFNISID
jgi:hypothetical protein